MDPSSGRDILPLAEEEKVHLAEQYIARNDSMNATPSGKLSKSNFTPTQVLIIFLLVIFALILFFLLLYYCTARYSRQRSIRRQVEAQKSISSSSAYDERPQTIFDHPERQLAVDQSVRTDQNSPASIIQLSDTDYSSPSNQNQPAPQVEKSKPVNAETSSPVAKTVPKVQDVPATKSSKEPLISSSMKLPLKPAEIILVKEAVASRKLRPEKKAHEKKVPEKIPSERRERSRSFDSSENHTIIGTLANLRDTLKESDADS